MPTSFQNSVIGKLQQSKNKKSHCTWNVSPHKANMPCKLFVLKNCHTPKLSEAIQRAAEKHLLSDVNNWFINEKKSSLATPKTC